MSEGMEIAVAVPVVVLFQVIGDDVIQDLPKDPVVVANSTVAIKKKRARGRLTMGLCKSAYPPSHDSSNT